MRRIFVSISSRSLQLLYAIKFINMLVYWNSSIADYARNTRKSKCKIMLFPQQNVKHMINLFMFYFISG